MTTFKADSPKAIWIGFQICFGFGIDLGQQQASLALRQSYLRKMFPPELL